MFATAEVGGLSEAIGLLAAIVILLVAFGSVLAMGLPIGDRAVRHRHRCRARRMLVRNVIDMPDFTTSRVAMIGIGVGIDYALFIVTRYRECLADGPRPGARRRARDRHRRARGAVRRHHGGDLACSACCS